MFKEFTALTHPTELSSHESEHEETVHEEPPASVLHTRRQALVPPKLITDGYESANEDADVSPCGQPQQSNNL